MVAISINHLEGLNFIADVKIVEPREKKNGVFIEYVKRDIRLKSPELHLILKAFGMRKVGEEYEMDSDIYTFYPWGYAQYKFIHFWLKIHWRIIHWLYDNGRMFKQIPSGEMFSWSYFTPYVWVKNLLTKIRE